MFESIRPQLKYHYSCNNCHSLTSILFNNYVGISSIMYDWLEHPLSLNMCILQSMKLRASLSAINSTPDLKMTHFNTVSILSRPLQSHNRSCNLFKCQNYKTAARALTAVEEQFIHSTTNFHFLLFQNILSLEVFSNTRRVWKIMFLLLLVHLFLHSI